jgi:hypothetical protein
MEISLMTLFSKYLRILVETSLTVLLKMILEVSLQNLLDIEIHMRIQNRNIRRKVMSIKNNMVKTGGKIKMHQSDMQPIKLRKDFQRLILRFGRNSYEDNDYGDHNDVIHGRDNRPM